MIPAGNNGQFALQRGRVDSHDAPDLKNAARVQYLPAASVSAHPDLLDNNASQESTF